jgi:hypothetical protein
MLKFGKCVVCVQGCLHCLWRGRVCHRRRLGFGRAEQATDDAERVACHQQKLPGAAAENFGGFRKEGEEKLREL